MRYSKFYKRLLAVNPRHRYLYTILLLALSAAVWFLFWYMPMQKTLDHERNKLAQLVADEEKFISETGVCKRLADELRIAEQDLVRSEDMLSDLQLMAACMACAQQAGLQLNALRMGDSKKKDAKVTMLFPIEATGSLSQVMHFFRQLADKKLGMESDLCSLQRQSGTTYALRGSLKRVLVLAPDELAKDDTLQGKKSPSTLKKAEGLGG